MSDTSESTSNSETSPQQPDTNSQTGAGASKEDPKGKKFKIGTIIPGVISIVILVGAGFIIGEIYKIPILSLLGNSQNQESVQNVESVFQNSVKNNGEMSSMVGDEWRLARDLDQKLAYAVYECAAPDPTKPISYIIFKQLLLDLTPDGNHEFKLPINKVLTSDDHGIVMTPYQRALINLSDAISINRMFAANAVEKTKPEVTEFEIAGFIVAFLGTLFVTLKTALPEAILKREKTPKELGVWIGIAAIIFSALGTGLNGFSISRNASDTLMKNANEMVQLRNLHMRLVMSTFTDPDFCGARQQTTAGSGPGKVVSAVDVLPAKNRPEKIDNRAVPLTDEQVARLDDWIAEVVRIAGGAGLPANQQPSTQQSVSQQVNGATPGAAALPSRTPARGAR